MAEVVSFANAGKRKLLDKEQLSASVLQTLASMYGAFNSPSIRLPKKAGVLVDLRERRIQDMYFEYLRNLWDPEKSMQIRENLLSYDRDIAHLTIAQSCVLIDAHLEAIREVRCAYMKGLSGSTQEDLLNVAYAGTMDYAILTMELMAYLSHTAGNQAVNIAKLHKEDIVIQNNAAFLLDFFTHDKSSARKVYNQLFKLASESKDQKNAYDLAEGTLKNPLINEDKKLYDRLKKILDGLAIDVAEYIESTGRDDLVGPYIDAHDRSMKRPIGTALKRKVSILNYNQVLEHKSFTLDILCEELLVFDCLKDQMEPDEYDVINEMISFKAAYLYLTFPENPVALSRASEYYLKDNAIKAYDIAKEAKTLAPDNLEANIAFMKAAGRVADMTAEDLLVINDDRLQELWHDGMRAARFVYKHADELRGSPWREVSVLLDLGDFYRTFAPKGERIAHGIDAYLLKRFKQSDWKIPYLAQMFFDHSFDEESPRTEEMRHMLTQECFSYMKLHNMRRHNSGLLQERKTENVVPLRPQWHIFTHPAKPVSHMVPPEMEYGVVREIIWEAITI